MDKVDTLYRVILNINESLKLTRECFEKNDIEEVKKIIEEIITLVDFLEIK